jgi:hypothetical protein
VFTTFAAAFQLLGLFFDQGFWAWSQVLIFTSLAAVQWLALDVVVDEDGLRLPGKRWRERIAWSDIEQCEVDSDGRPELVLVSGERKRLPTYVPNPGWKAIQQRWQTAQGIDAVAD